MFLIAEEEPFQYIIGATPVHSYGSAAECLWFIPDGGPEQSLPGSAQTHEQNSTGQTGWCGTSVSQKSRYCWQISPRRKDQVAQEDMRLYPSGIKTRNFKSMCIYDHTLKNLMRTLNGANPFIHSELCKLLGARAKTDFCSSPLLISFCFHFQNFCVCVIHSCIYSL